MEKFIDVMKKLKELDIEFFEIVHHPPAVTTEQADEFIEGFEGVRTKTMFLCDKKKRRFYLAIMDDSKRMDMNAFAEMVGEKKVKMASDQSLADKMNLPAGVVSVFGLLYNDERDIEVYFDKDIMDEEKLTFHPNTNTMTMFLRTEDVLKYLDELGYEAKIVEL